MESPCHRPKHQSAQREMNEMNELRRKKSDYLKAHLTQHVAYGFALLA
jgi:hypothetical protein